MAVKNMKSRLVAIIGVLLFSLMITGCKSNASDENITENSVESTSTDERMINIDKLEIYHFHGTNQCYSCITVGDYAEETVNTYFKEELEKGIIVFDHIDGDLVENKELVLKYGATGSSLWFGTYDGNDFSAEENTNVWYKIKDKTTYMDYLKEFIEQKLAGN